MIKSHNKKIVVLGGAGYIGNYLLSSIANKYTDIIVIDNFSVSNPEKETLNQQLQNQYPNIRYIRNDINDIESYIDKICDTNVLVSFASLNSKSESEVNASLYLYNNIQKLQAFLEKFFANCNGNLIKVIHASSMAIYDENHELNPRSTYGITKLMQEHLLRSYCYRNKISLDIFRIFNVFGPNQEKYYKTIGVLPMLYNHIITSKSVKILGGKDLSRDFVYIDDVIHFLVSSLNSISNRAINTFDLGSGESTSLYEVCRYFKELDYLFDIELINNTKDVIKVKANNIELLKCFGQHSFYKVNEFIKNYYKK